MDGDTDGAALGSEEGIDEGNELGSLLGSDDGVPDGLGISSVGAELVVGFADGLEQQSEMIFGITKRSAKWLFMNYGLGFKRHEKVFVICCVSYLLEGLPDGIMETVGLILGVAEGRREGRELGWREGVLVGAEDGL